MGYILSFVVYYMLDQLTRPLWISTGLANSTPTIDAVRGVIGGAVIGFSIGIPQWYVVLRINKIRNAAWWIPATVLAYGIGLGIASLFYTLAKSARWDAFFGGSLNMPVVVLGAVLGSLVIGVITGVTIAWLLRNHSVEQNVDSAQQLTSTATP